MKFAVDLIDNDCDDGVQVCRTWAEADAFRDSYEAAVNEHGEHPRLGIIRKASESARVGYHRRAPRLAAEGESDR